MPWIKLLLENLSDHEPVKSCLHLIKTECSLPTSKQPVTCPYPAPHQNSPLIPAAFWRSLLLLLTHLRLGPAESHYMICKEYLWWLGDASRRAIYGVVPSTSYDGIPASNSAGCKDIYILWALCVIQ